MVQLGHLPDQKAYIQEVNPSHAAHINKKSVVWLLSVDLFGDLSHLLPQIVVVFSQNSILLHERLADLCSQLQISLFLTHKTKSDTETLLMYSQKHKQLDIYSASV